MANEIIFANFALKLSYSVQAVSRVEVIGYNNEPNVFV